MHRLDDAVKAFARAVDCSDGNPVMLAGLGYASARRGDGHPARRIAAELSELPSGPRRFAYELALIFAALGERERARTSMTTAVRERSGWLAYRGVEPRLAVWRTDPELAAALARVTP
jgi:Flp pilus assembly protein TadD